LMLEERWSSFWDYSIDFWCWSFPEPFDRIYLLLLSREVDGPLL